MHGAGKDYSSSASRTELGNQQTNNSGQRLRQQGGAQSEPSMQNKSEQSDPLKRIHAAQDKPLPPVTAQILSTLRDQLWEMDATGTHGNPFLNLFQAVKNQSESIKQALRFHPNAPELAGFRQAYAVFLQRFNLILKDQGWEQTLQSTNDPNEHETALHQADDDETDPEFENRVRNLGKLRIVCLGLSVCADPSCGNLFKDEPQLHATRTALQTMNAQLLTAAKALGMPKASHGAGVQLDILNWVSRGLGEQLLQLDAFSCEAFRLMLHLFAGLSETELNTYLRTSPQLAKYAVQLNSMFQYKLVEFTVENLTMIRDCTLKLCSATVLDKLKVDSEDEVAIISIGNTVKDLIEGRLMFVEDPALVQMLARLVGLLVRLPYKKTLAADSRTLSNASNFLRILIKSGIQQQAAFQQAQAVQLLNAACQRILESVDSKEFRAAWVGGQSLSNLLSFINLCWLHLPEDAQVLAAATEKVLAKLIALGAWRFASAQALAPLVGGLRYVFGHIPALLTPEVRSFISAVMVMFTRVTPEAWRDEDKQRLLSELKSMLHTAIITPEDLRPALKSLLNLQVIPATQSVCPLLDEAITMQSAVEPVRSAPIMLPALQSAPASAVPTLTVRGVPGTSDWAPPGSALASLPGLAPTTTAGSSSARSSARSSPKPETIYTHHNPDLGATSLQPVFLPKKPASVAPSSQTAKVNSNAKTTGSKKKISTTKRIASDWESDAHEWQGRLQLTTGDPVERMKRLAKTNPSLLFTTIDEDGVSRSPLQFALMGGKLKVAAWLMNAIPHERRENPIALLDKLLAEEEVLIGAAQVEALTKYLSGLPAAAKKNIRTHLEGRASSIRAGYLEVLQKLGLASALTAEQDSQGDPDDDDDVEDSGIEIDVMQLMSGSEKAVKVSTTDSRVKKTLVLKKPAAIAQEIAKHQDSKGQSLMMSSYLMRGYQSTQNYFRANPGLAAYMAAQARHDGVNMLMLAASNKDHDLAKLLLASATAQTQLRTVDKRGMNALMRAALEEDFKMAELLLAAGSATEQLCATSMVKGNALLIATGKNNQLLIRLFLQDRPSRMEQVVPVAIGEGKSPLLIALNNKKFDTAKLLVDLVPDASQDLIRLKQGIGDTLMIHMIKTDNIDAASFLLQHSVYPGAHLFSQELVTGGKDALQIARELGSPVMQQLLTSALEKFDVPAYFRNILKTTGKTHIVKSVVGRHPELLSGVRNQDRNLLFEFITSNEKILFEALIETSAGNTLLSKPTRTGMTPLMYAAMHGHSQIAEAILKQANAEAQMLALDISSHNALMHAAGLGNKDCVEHFLKQKSAKQAAIQRNQRQQNAEDIARQNGHVELAEILRKFVQS
jgi:ankyrin repeat protein